MRHGRAIKSETSARSWDAWWFGLLLVFGAVQVVFLVRSLQRDVAEAPNDVASIVVRTLIVPTLVLIIGYIVLLLLFLKPRLRNAVLKRRGLAVLATSQVTAEFARTLVLARGDIEGQRLYTREELALWRLTLVDAGEALLFFDGSTEPSVVFEIPWASVTRARPTLIAGRPISFPGFDLHFRLSGQLWVLPILPVGRGPAGAFALGHRRVETLVEYFTSRVQGVAHPHAVEE